MHIDFSLYSAQYKPLIKLGIPIIIGQIGTIVLSFADTIMIGHHSTPELAAAAFVSQLFNLGILLAMGFSYGLTPIVGNLFGKGDEQGIGTAVRNALLANSVVALLLSAAYIVLYFFLDKLGQPQELIPYMRPYYIVNLISVPFVCWFNVFKQTADGSTDTVKPMWILIGGNILNIIGNYMLIYGHGGMPELGLLGAGLSTMLSRIIMAFAMAYVFFFTRRYRPYAHSFVHSRITRAWQQKLNGMGWPLGLQMSMESGAWSLCSIIVGWIGAEALAGHQIMLSVSQLFYQFYYAIAAAVAIRVSLYCGQKDYGKITPTAWAGFHICLCVAVLLTGPVLLLRNEIGWAFTDSAKVAATVASAITPLIVYQVADGLQCIFSNALRGLSNVKPLMLVAFIAYFVVSIPLSYTFGIVLGGSLEGVWFAFPFGLSLAGVLYHHFFMLTLRRMTGARS